MAFNKRIWKGRQGTGLNKFSINGATPVTVINQPDSVTEQGDALSAGNLNDLEDRIYTAFEDEATARANADSNLLSAITQIDHRLENIEQSKGDYIVASYKDGSTTPSGKGKWCVVEGVEGVSRVENNLVNPADSSSSTVNGITFTNNGDGSWTISGATGASPAQKQIVPYNMVANHSYLLAGARNNVILAYIGQGTDRVDEGSGIVATITTDTYKALFIYVRANTTLANPVTIRPVSTDLNVYFGTSDLSFLGATDSAKLATIQRDYPHLLLPSDYGTRIVDWTGNGVRAEGVNIWDEEWEVGALNGSGEVIATATTRRTTSFIPVTANETYYQLSPSSAFNGRIAYYNANKECIYFDSNGIPSTGKFFDVTGNTAFVRITFGETYGTSYGHDIQICLYSLPSEIRTVYHPYQSNTLSFPSTTLKSAGSVRDTLELNVEVSGVAKRRDTQRVKTVVYDGSSDENWQIYGSAQRFYIQTADQKINSGSTVPNLTCDKLMVVRKDLVDTYDKAVGVEYRSFVLRIDSTITTVEQLRTWLAQNPVTINYELATPVETLSDPILDNTLLTESGGRMATVQTGTIVDGIADLGFITL